MKLHAVDACSKARLASFTLGLVLCAPLMLGSSGQAAQTKSDLVKIRSKAATQHEIVVLLLGKKEFDKAAAEAEKIFEMNWPPDQEPTLLKELLFFADQFLHHDQAALGLRLLEKSTPRFKSVPSLIEIWKEKGYLFKKMDQRDRALECFREAQRLEQSIK